MMLFVEYDRQMLAIQVCADLNSMNSDREIGNLIRLAKNMKDVHRLAVVSGNPEKRIQTTDNCSIEMIPAEQFYLSLQQFAGN